MKKLGKRLSFLTKIMLVIGLLISNLSSLSLVFAYETTGNLVVTLNETNDKLNIKYLEELAEEVEKVDVNVYENYTYLDNTSMDGIEEKSYSLTTSEEFDKLKTEGLEVETILSDIVFDGLYEVKVELISTELEEETVIDSVTYSTNVTHDSGLELKLYDVDKNEIVALEDGRYPISSTNPSFKVVAKVLPGGLSPRDMFVYEEITYFAEELLELEFSSDADYDGRLYGDYILPVEVTLAKQVDDVTTEEVKYQKDVNVLYGAYEDNTLVMNTAADDLELGSSYEFYGNTKDGILYVLLNNNKSNTMLDLYKMADYATMDSEYITYTLSNSEYDDVLKTYNDMLEENKTALEDGTAGEDDAVMSLEEYLEAIQLDDTAMLTLTNDGLTVTYKVVVVADVNNDNVLTDEDLLGLVEQVVGNADANLEKSDLYGNDKKVDTLDVMYLDQVMKSETWDVELTEEEATLDARLEVSSEDITSGDEFTVNYVLSLTDYTVNGVSGLFKYDQTMLELVSVKTANEWLGSSKDGRFLYLGDESLLLPEVLEVDDTTETDGAEEDTSLDDGRIDTDKVTPLEYVLVTATFRALKSGTSTITLEDTEFFNQDSYLLVDELVLSTDVVVNASTNNNLSSLTVGGQTIALEEDVLDYEITVSNDVTTIDVEAVVENVAANITSLIYPEELVEGENTVTVTVTSENGDVKVYTVKVIREAAPEEEESNVQINYDNNYYEEDNDDEEVVIPDVDEDEEDDEDTDSDDEVEEDNTLSRVIIIILILFVIAGLVYLIFKDDDEETKKVNKEINKLKKEDVKLDRNVTKTVNKTNNSNSKKKQSINKKKER